MDTGAMCMSQQGKNIRICLSSTLTHSDETELHALQPRRDGARALAVDDDALDILVARDTLGHLWQHMYVKSAHTICC